MFSLINSIFGLKPKRKLAKKPIKKKKVTKRKITKKKKVNKKKSKRKVTRGGSKKGLKMSKYSPSNKNFDYVLFYSDGCPHCVIFKDRLNLIKNKVNCKLMMIDAWDNKNEKIVSKHNIMGVPTLMDKNYNTVNIPMNDNDLIRLLNS